MTPPTEPTHIICPDGCHGGHTIFLAISIHKLARIGSGRGDVGVTFPAWHDLLEIRTVDRFRSSFGTISGTRDGPTHRTQARDDDYTTHYL
jgi:hypothetical protein